MDAILALNYWTIGEIVGSDRQGVRVMARCICGTERVLLRSRILTGQARSCGCKKRELAMASRPSRAEVFWTNVDQSGGRDSCWTWTAATDKKGYGTFWNGQAARKAHRYAYELIVGPVPEGLVLDHLCRNRACVNPAHLEPVTSGENTRRGITGAHLRNTDTCRSGKHAWPESAVVIGGRRTCAPCRQQGRKS